METEMSDELQFHLEARADDLMSRRGLTREEALRQARIEFGGVEKYKEESRHARGLWLIDEIRNDLRYGIRQLSKSPIFTLAAVITLAVGIGANTTIFTFENAVMLKPVPVSKPEQLHQLEWTSSNPSFVRRYSGFTWHDDERKASFSYPIYEYIRDHTGSFSGLLAFGGLQTMNLRAAEVAAEVQTVAVSGNYFEVLGVVPVLGRSITAEDAQPGAAPVAVLSYSLWQRAFGSNPGVIGRSVTLNQTPVVIVGVLPKEFLGLRPIALVTTDVYVPFAAPITSEKPQFRAQTTGYFNLLMFGRLRPAIGEEAARFETEQLMRQAIESEPPAKAYDPPQVVMSRAARGMDGVRHQFASYLALMMGVVGMILVIACANLAGLLFSRAELRRREVGTRLALGAPRLRLIRQHLTESLLLSAIGTVIAVPVASFFVEWLPALIPDSEFRLGVDLSFDYRVFLFSVLLCVSSSVLFGLAPALRATRVDILTMLKGSGERLPGKLRWGKLLITIQVGLSLMLLAGATLFLRTLHNVQSAPLGFDPSSVLSFSIDPTTSGYKPDQMRNVIEEASRRIKATPGVRAVAFSNYALLSGTRSTAKVCFPGQPVEQTYTLTVSPQFFETMGMPVFRGRDFSTLDNSGSGKVVIVNETFARRFLKGRDSVGTTVNLLPPKDQVTCPGKEGETLEVIGIVADAKYDSLRNDAPPTAYLAYLQHDEDWTTFQVATSSDPASMLPTIRRVMANFDPNLFLLETRPLSTYVKLFLLPERLLSSLVTFVAVIAVFLACIGIYGTIAYTVSQRTGEIGVRMALGASRSEIVRMSFHESLLPVGIGVVLGLIGASALMPLLESMLYGISPVDPLSLLGAAAILIVAAIAAAIIPARRASRVDPMTALRYE